MLPVILGALAMGTAGYGVKKCLDNEDCCDSIKDKIGDAAEELYMGLDKLSEKMGLNEIVIPIKHIEHKVPAYSEDIDEFEEIYKLKQSIYNSLDLAENQQFKIKKDKADGITITPKIDKNLHSYKFVLSSLASKLKESKNDIKYAIYLDAFKNLCETRIITKGKFNGKSTEAILKAMRVLLEEGKVIEVNLT